MGGLDTRVRENTFAIAAISVMIAAVMVVPVGSMLGLVGPTENSLITGDGTHIMGVSPRSVDYRYYDFFNVPFGEWWNMRWEMYHGEQIISYTYPTMFYYYSQPPGNVKTYSNMMLDVKGRNMSELNMNSHPEFLPFLGPARGGNATLDWYMQYLTKAEMARYPEATQAWADGWVISLNGTTTMDRQAAMAVLNVTSAGFDNFTTWWTANERGVEDAYSSWLLYEGNKRLDIYNMYEYPLVPLTFNLIAQKVADRIILTYDIVSWGMEAMMTRWLHDAFMPTEHFLEGFNMHASIGPEKGDVDITTEVAYGIYAYETTLVPEGRTHGDPCWVFETNPQDILPSSIAHPKSDFQPYRYFSYDSTAPGSLWYGKSLPYDYTPGPHNLSVNETLRVEFPTGPQLFKEQAFYPNGTPVLDREINQRIVNSTANMTFNYGEPMSSDNPELSPGSMSVDNVAGRLTFKGPIDMWTWSKDQTKHSSLASEWDRLGIIPCSIPYLEFTWDRIPQPPRANGYGVSAMSSPVIAGEPVTFTVTVYDQYNNVFPNYRGTLRMNSTDPAAALPGDYTFTTADSGVHVFNSLIFMTAGLQDLMLVDAANSSITGRVLGIYVTAAAVADHFVLSSFPGIVGVNIPQDLTVMVCDQYGQPFVGYVGTITFGSNRSGDVVLPSDTTVPLGSSHVTIPDGVTFTSTGWFRLTASDTVDHTINGETSVRVELNPPRIDHFVVTGETELAPGGSYDLTVRAIDQFGSTMQTYTGTVHFATNASEGTYSLPADTTFTLADNGVKAFARAMSFSEIGTYEVKASDAAYPVASGSLTGIHVAARGNIVYTAYDFFQEPWGEWFWNPGWRQAYYAQDYILSNAAGQNTMLYDPTQSGDQGIIYAPYRFNMTATNVTTVDVHHPEFMPILGGVGPRMGAEASMHIRMQYLDNAWWWSYWVPQFGKDDPFLRAYVNNTNDGYLLGTVYNIELNREAAYEWLGMPTAEDPVTWWSANQFNYDDAWQSWIANEGNNRLDIYSGYMDRYYPEKLWTNMTVDSDGDILLRISHVSWGYEVLMTRWLSETQLCAHQPYMEDFDLEARYGNGIADMTFDAVAQYNFHAVKANASTGNDGAWVWEPQRIDYWPSWAQSPAHHASEYDPYAGPSWGGKTTYQSWNSGDPKFGSEVEYTSTPGRFNLNSFQTLVVKLPMGSNVPGYLGKGVGHNAIINMSMGETHDYDALRYTGTASLGYVISNPSDPLDIPSLYDPITKTLTIMGPYYFDNPGGRAGGMLYHGAPWIEFNVGSAAPIPDTHNVTKVSKGPRESAVTWEYTPATYGEWTGHIVNKGLRSLVVDVYDITTGQPDQVMHQRIRFTSYGAYPTGEVDTASVVMSPTHRYSITVTPNGPRGSSCTVMDTFAGPEPPVANFSFSVNHMNVTVDASTAFDPDGTIVSYDWTFGDGGAASGVIAHHMYFAPGIYQVTLTLTDNDGLVRSTVRSVDIVDNYPTPSFTCAIIGRTAYVNASGSFDDYGIVSYTWNWGDGTTGSGVTATHTYNQPNATSKSLLRGPVDAWSGRATPYPPHPIFGYTYASDGFTIMTGCVVTVTNLRTGESLVNTSDPEYGIYLVDAGSFALGWVIGDLVNVTATKGLWIGWSVAPLTDSPNGYDWIDVTLNGMELPPFTRTITLIVTDTLGQVNAVSKTVTLYP